MLNEWQEFLDYTRPVEYQASGKKDTTWLGRFTFEALRDFSGMNRILTILARGFLFHASDGTLLPGDPRERIAFAHNGLCAWCSIPEGEGKEKEDWQHRTDFASLHRQFPNLVDEEGGAGSATTFTGLCSLPLSIQNWFVRTMRIVPVSWTRILTGCGAPRCSNTRLALSLFPQRARGRSALTIWSPTPWSWAPCAARSRSCRRS